MQEPAARLPVAGWSWTDGLLAVLAAHVVLILGGSVVLVAGGWSGTDLPITATFAATVPFWLACGAAARWLVVRSGGSARESLGLDLRPLELLGGLVVGVASQYLLIPLLYWPILRLLDQDTDDLEKVATKLAGSASGSLGTVLFLLMTCLCAPIAEELLYRGVLLRSQGWPGRATATAIGVVSVVFGASHFQALQFPGLAVFGLVLCLLTWRTGRIGAAVAAHVAFNASTAIPLVLHR